MVESPNPSSGKREHTKAEPGTAAGANSAGSNSGNRPDGNPREENGPASASAGESSKLSADRGTPPGERAAKNHISLKSLTSLERLRDRVETAAHELKRLREENEALSKRIKELESRPNVDPQGTYLSLDHDPEHLRRKISGFIESIDRYLEKERKSH